MNNIYESRFYPPDVGQDVLRSGLIIEVNEMPHEMVDRVVSTATPLGGAVLGAKCGETVKYETGRESLRAKVVSIEVSPLFQES